MNVKKPVRNKQGGFFTLISLFIVMAGLLWYFKIDVRGFIDANPEIQVALLAIWGFLKASSEFIVNLWDNYLGMYVLWAWEKVKLGYQIVKTFVGGFF